MIAPRYHVALDDIELAAGFDLIRAEFDVPDAHTSETMAEAKAAVERGPRVPPGAATDRRDARDLDLVAIDPPGSRDLDQAFTAERRGEGYRVFYAIADVAAWVTPGAAMDTEAQDRGVTLYAPDRRASLHPPIINEGAGSLAPGVDRPAVLWTLDLDPDGEVATATACRATVRVREAMTYLSAQQEIDGEARGCLELLAEVGRLRQALEVERDGVSLSLPTQEVRRDEHGHLQLVFDEPLAVENWNAQISLMTGTAAARIMIDAGVGVLRTLPRPDPDTIDELRRSARHLEVNWPADRTYADMVRTLDPTRPRQAAMLMRSARGLRGAGYAAFTSPEEIPADAQHSAIGDVYAHVTAPLRRVCDRFANEIVLSVCAERQVPGWVGEALPALPKIMGRSRQRQRAMERAVVDYMEAVMLEPAVDTVFEAVVVGHRQTEAVIQLRDPAVVATLEPKRPLGEEVSVRLVSVEVGARTATFELM